MTLNDPDIKLKNTFKNINNLNEEGIYISTFQKLSMLSPEDLDETQSFFDLIIIDEGHSEPSPVWRENRTTIRCNKSCNNGNTI